MPPRRTLRIDPTTVRRLAAAALLLFATATVAQDQTAPTSVLDAPQQLVYGQSLQLSAARSSDAAPGRIARYRWTRLEGGGGAMARNLTLETTVAAFTVPHLVGSPLAPGRHRFSVVVIDEAGNASSPDERQVFVIDPAPAAVLDAPSQVVIGLSWQLSGARSFDPGGRIVRYVWTRTEGPTPGAMPLGQPVQTETASLALGAGGLGMLPIGTHRFSLVVVDDGGNQSPPDQRQVVVIADPAPTAVLDAPRELAFGSALQLSGRRSFDAAPGRIVRYRWTHLSGAGSGMPLDQPVVNEVSAYTVPQPRGQPLAAGQHVFDLVVIDDAGNHSKPAQVSVTVTVSAAR